MLFASVSVYFNSFCFGRYFGGLVFAAETRETVRT